MLKWIIVCVNGFQGIGYYNTYKEAEEAARFRSLCGPLPWEVREIFLPVTAK